MKKPIPFAKTLIPLAISVCFFFLYCWAQAGPTSSAKNDFLPLFISGKLAGTTQLYDAPTVLGWQQTLVGGTMESCLFTRPPFYALAFVPLSHLPYTAAYVVFQIINVAALLGFVFLIRGRNPTIALTCSLCLPLLLALGNGQDLPILIFLFALSIRFLDRGEDFLAGLVLTLCAIKGQFFVLIPFVLLYSRRWRFLSGGATGGTLLIALSFLAGGANWISDYRRILARPGINPNVWQMGNLRALAEGLSGGALLQAGLVAAAILAFGWLMTREPRFDARLGLAVLAGLLISHHGYMQDFALLLPVSVLLESYWHQRASGFLKKFVLSPLPYLAVMLGTPFSLLLPTSVVGLFASLAARNRDTPYPAGSKP